MVTNYKRLTTVMMRRIFHVTLVLVLLSISGALFLPNADPLIAKTHDPYIVDTFIDSDGREIAKVIFPGRPPDIKATAVDSPIANIAMGINIPSAYPFPDNDA
jgi:hypothetical protein